MNKPEELTTSYEFTKARIAEIESLRDENAKLKVDIAAEVVQKIAESEIWKELESLRAFKAEIEKQEPIYQHQSADRRWIDQHKHSYDYNVANGHSDRCRIVYAAPVVSPDVEKLISERDYHLANAKQVYSECSALKAENQSLKAELEGERAAALNYRNDAIEAGKKCDGLVKQRDELLETVKECVDVMAYHYGTNARITKKCEAAIASVKGGA